MRISRKKGREERPRSSGEAGMLLPTFSKSGFTLVEVMVAVFFGAMILVAATSFIFSMGELWGRGAETRLFHKHARGVSRFIEQAFEKASLTSINTSEDGVVVWGERGGAANKGRKFMTFELRDSPGAFAWPEERLPFVVCSLEYDESEGLFILWQSRLEENFQDEEPRRSLISPFVRDFKYHYIDYEEENPEWEILDDPKTESATELLIPQRLELVFEFQGEQITRQIDVPSTFSGVPLF